MRRLRTSRAGVTRWPAVTIAMAVLALSAAACTSLAAPAVPISEYCGSIPAGSTGSVLTRGTRTATYFDANPGVSGVQLETGRLGSPTTESMVSSAIPRTTYSGNATFGPIAGIEHMLVEGVLQADNTHPWASLRPTITLERFDGTTIEYNDSNATIDRFCFASTAVGTPTRQGYFKVLIPMTGVSEPGFSVRAQVRAVDTLGLERFLGSDVNVVKVGAEPIDHDAVVDRAIGLVVDDNFIVDRNSEPSDDLEGILKTRIGPAARDKINSIGSQRWARNDADGHERGYFQLNSVNASALNLDLELAPTKQGSGPVDPPPFEGCIPLLGSCDPHFGVTADYSFDTPSYTAPAGLDDDEARLRASLTIPSLAISGGLGWDPKVPLISDLTADFHLEATVNLAVSLAINVSDVDPRLLEVDLQVEDASIVVSNYTIDIDQPGYDFLLNENAILGAAVKGLNVVSRYWPLLDSLTGASQKLSTTINQSAIGPALVRADEVLTNGVELPNGSGFTIPRLEFEETCARMGCNGYRAGDVLISQEGLELGLGATIDDRKPSGAPRKFPKVYVPNSTTSMDQLLVSRNIPGTPTAYDVGLFVNAAAVNQALRAVTEPAPVSGGKGLLDIDGLSLAGLTVNTRAENAPILVPQAFPGVAGTKPLSVYLPNLQVDIPGVGGWSVDLKIGVGAELDPVTHRFIVSIGAAYDVDTLWCANDLSFICLIPEVVTDYLKGPLSELLADRTIGQYHVPQVAGLELGALTIKKVGSHLGAYIDIIPAPGATMTATAHPSSYMYLESFDFGATPTHFPGSGPYSYHWKVYDAHSSGHETVVYETTQITSAVPAVVSVPKAAFGSTPLGPYLHTYAAKAEVTVSRGGRTAVVESDVVPYIGH